MACIGLQNSVWVASCLSTYQRDSDSISAPVRWKLAFVYLHDIVGFLN